MCYSSSIHPGNEARHASVPGGWQQFRSHRTAHAEAAQPHGLAAATSFLTKWRNDAMYRVTRIARVLSWFAALATIAVVLASCASLPLPADLQREEGYYYGTGTGASQEEATAEAKRTLIQLAIIESRESAGIRSKIVVSEEVADSFAPAGIKPVAQGEDGGTWTVVCRVKRSDWDAFQAKRMDAARAEILPMLPELAPDGGMSLGDRLGKSAAIIDRLYREALADILTEGKDGTPLVARTLESSMSTQLAAVSVSMDTPQGFVDNDTEFKGTVHADGDTGPVPILARWSVRGAEPVDNVVTSSKDGSFELSFPADPAFHNHAVTLELATAFSAGVYGSDALRKADEGTSVAFVYQHFDDLAGYFGNEVLVPGGTYAIGAVARDTRAARKEAARSATVKDFFMDRQLVTNALYAMFLADTGSESFPEYWDNPDYNQDDQPVIGVSYQDAVAFAAWLSGKLGVVKRLPTEAEWEVAARGGKDVIYPWGDQAPDEGAYANYAGDDGFPATSPVGSFADGLNALGIADMAGNVWQWTSTPRDAASSNMIIKGGSWMDGPLELRISNRRDVNPSRGYVDVGIRLVREVSE